MRVTRPQLAKIWATAKERGISPDLVRSMTPAGSVGMLTVAQASELIDALVRGRAPDYSRVASAPRGRRFPSASSAPPRETPRRPAGIYALPSLAAALLDSANITWLAEHWRHKDGSPWTELQVIDWLSKRRFRHGGPMSICRSAKDLTERIELTKAVILRTRAAQGDAQSKRDVADWRLRQGRKDEGSGVKDEAGRARPAAASVSSFIPHPSSFSPPPLRLVRSERPQFEEVQT